MNKFVFYTIPLCFLLFFSSCTTLSNILNPDYSVEITEDYTDIQKQAEQSIKEKSYIKHFYTTDKVSKKHEIFFLNEKYFSVDGVIYAYRFHNIMYYGPSLKYLNGQSIYDLPDKMIGVQGYATVVKNPAITASFIFSQKLFGQKGYSSMYEAGKINGVVFSSPKGDTQYIDDFGKLRRYSYFDYFENIFGTRKQNVNHEMYQAFEFQKTYKKEN